MSSDPFVDAITAWIEVSMGHSMRKFLRFARAQGFSMSHLGALFHVHQIGSCGVTEIGEHLGVTSAAASQMLDRLVHQGLVLRTDDPVDRRVKRIELSDAGQQILNEGIRARESWVYELADMLSAEEKAAIIPALTLMIEKLNELTPAVESTG